MALRVAADPYQELEDLASKVEAFHDRFAAEMPYGMVMSLQKAIGREFLSLCLRCHMHKYDVEDDRCRQCRPIR